MMPLSEIFFLAIVLYLLYRFVFGFLLPVVRTTRQVRQQFRNMQDGVNGGQQHPFMQNEPFGSGERTGSARPSQPSAKQQRPSGGKPPAGDYIDFEEIK